MVGQIKNTVKFSNLRAKYLKLLAHNQLQSLVVGEIAGVKYGKIC